VKVLKIKTTYQCFSVTLHDVDSHYKWREKSRDSAVNISTGLGAGRSGVLIPVGQHIFSKTSKTVMGPTQPFIQWVQGSAFSEDTKRPGRDSGQLPPSSSDVKNEWIYTSISHTCLHGVYKEVFTLVRNHFQRFHIWLVVRTGCDVFKRDRRTKHSLNRTVLTDIHV